MPLGTEMLSLVGMIVLRRLVDRRAGRQDADRAVCAADGAGAVRRRMPVRVARPAGIVAALVYISIPWIALVSTQGLVEGAFAFYLFAALYAVLLWRSDRARLTRRSDARSPAAASRWPGFWPAAPCRPSIRPSCSACCRWRRTSSIDRCRSGAASAPRGSPSHAHRQAARLCSCSRARWAADCGSPRTRCSPAIRRIRCCYASSTAQTRTPEKNAQWSQAHRPPNYRSGRPGAARAGTSWSAATGSARWSCRWRCWRLFPCRRRLALAVGGYFGFVFVAWWLLTHRIDRFWVPALPLAALLAGIGGDVEQRATGGGRRWRSSWPSGLTFNFVVITGGLAGRQSLPGRSRPCCATIPRASSRGIGISTSMPTKSTRRAAGRRCPAVRSRSAGDLQHRVRRLDLRAARPRPHARAKCARRCTSAAFSHVYVSWGEIDRYRSPGNYGITDFLQPRVFDELVAAGVLERLPPLPDDSRARLFRVCAAAQTLPRQHAVASAVHSDASH